MLCACENQVWHHCIHLLDVCSFPVSSQPISFFSPTTLPSPLSLTESFFKSTELFCPPYSRCSYLHASPPPAHFSVDGDLSRPWLMLAQPPPPLCSLWWWGSLSCDTESAEWASDWNADSPEFETLGKIRQRKDGVYEKLCTKTLCALFFGLFCWDGSRPILSQNVVIPFHSCFFFLSYKVFCPTFTLQRGGT